MTKFLLQFLMLFAISKGVYCQDLIIMKNGDEIKSKIIEVLPDVIKYKKTDNIDGPTYTESKSKVFMIKYQNGSKDVFNQQQDIQQTTNNPTPVNNEELKKNKAVTELENYFMNTFKKVNPVVFYFQSFKKTNGILKNVFGQEIYEIEFQLTIQFAADSWKKGNGMEGYWNNFNVYLSQPTLSPPDSYTYDLKFYPRGTVVTLGCIASMENSDNGFKLKSYDIKTIQNSGVKSLQNNESSSASTQQQIVNKPVDISAFNGYMLTENGNYFLNVQNITVGDELQNTSEIKNKILTVLSALKIISQPKAAVDDTLSLVSRIDFSYGIYSNTNSSYFANCVIYYSLVSKKNGNVLFQNTYKPGNFRLLSQGFSSKLEAQRDIINREINQTLNQFFIGNFPITAEIIEITEKNRKEDEAKFVKINVGRNKGIFTGFEFIIPELNKNYKKGDLSVTEVFEDYSICKVKNLEKEILSLKGSGKQIKVVTKYKAE